MESIGEMEAKVRALADKLHTLKGRDYRYTHTLEARARQAADDWPEVRRQAEAALSRGRMSLGSLDSDIARALSQGRRATTEEDMAAADDALERLEKRITQTERGVAKTYDDFAARIRRLDHKMEHLLWATEAWAATSVDPYPDEALVDAAEAQWITSDDEGPKGILFLTDSRVIMEQKEKVATKKVLFITTEKKLVQAMQFAAPIGAVEVQEASDERGGFLGLGKREMLKLRFTTPTEGKRIGSATLRLRGGADNEAWAALIQQVQRGDIAADAVQPSGETPATTEPAAPPREIPTHCPSCGALLTQSIVKGMKELRCAYCGAVIRL